MKFTSDTPSHVIRRWIIRKLHLHGCWGKGHVSLDNLAKGIHPSSKKIILKEVKQLVREGILIQFPHGGEQHIYLNRYRIDEIREIIESPVV